MVMMMMMMAMIIMTKIDDEYEDSYLNGEIQEEKEEGSNGYTEDKDR